MEGAGGEAVGVWTFGAEGGREGKAGKRGRMGEQTGSKRVFYLSLEAAVAAYCRVGRFRIRLIDHSRNGRSHDRRRPGCCE